jgi:hypothetical protein
MCCTRFRIFKINGIEHKGIIEASSVLGISLSTVLRKYKKSETFEHNGNIVESYLVKPERKKTDDRKEKHCTKCNNIFPNNTDFFHLDTHKVKLGHATVLSSMCITCKAKYQSDNLKKKRIDANLKGISLYSLLSEEKKSYMRKYSSEWAKNNREKVNEAQKERVKRKTNGIINTYKKGRDKSKKNMEEMSDYYITRLILRHNKELSRQELLKYPEFLDLYRANLKLKRACNQLTTSTN